MTLGRGNQQTTEMLIAGADTTTHSHYAQVSLFPGRAT